MKSVKLAYSISVHKSQGGSAKIIILLTPKAHQYMLNSNLLYVGVTRASEKVIHFGEPKTVNLSVKKKADTTRHTNLIHFITNNKETK
jgi:exodeoxyribonuclease V alpha subunit